MGKASREATPVAPPPPPQKLCCVDQMHSPKKQMFLKEMMSVFEEYPGFLFVILKMWGLQAVGGDV